MVPSPKKWSGLRGVMHARSHHDKLQMLRKKKKKFVCEVSNFLRLITFELQVWLMETWYRWKENFITFPITLKLHKMGDHRGNQRCAQNQGKHQKVPKNYQEIERKKKKKEEGNFHSCWSCQHVSITIDCLSILLEGETPKYIQ